MKHLRLFIPLVLVAIANIPQASAAFPSGRGASHASKSSVRLIAAAIAPSNNKTYYWYSDGTVSSGNSTTLEKHRKPSSFTPPRGKSTSDIVGIAIGAGDKTWTWYDDGTVSSGSTTDLDKHSSPTSYSLPKGKSVSAIVEMAIASTGHVYTWFEDSTVCSGSATKLDEHRSPYRYALPGKLGPGDVVGLGIASDDHVYAWFKTGVVSSGSSKDLDKFQTPVRYTSPKLSLVAEAPTKGSGHSHPGASDGHHSGGWGSTAEATKKVSATSTENRAVYDKCVDFAYAAYEATQRSDYARKHARENCKDTDLAVTKLLYPYYKSAQRSDYAIGHALDAGRDHPTLVGRLDIVKFAAEKFAEAMRSDYAIKAAIKQTLALPKVDKYTLPCLKKEYPFLKKSQRSDYAMKNTFASCSE